MHNIELSRDHYTDTSIPVPGESCFLYPVTEKVYESPSTLSFIELYEFHHDSIFNAYYRDIVEILLKRSSKWFDKEESVKILKISLVEAYLMNDQKYPNIPKLLKKLGTTIQEVIEENPNILRDLHIDLNRFINNQESDACGHNQALSEIKNGKKTNHWIWWNFPQSEAITRGKHRSWETEYFGIRNRGEAIAYINNPILKNHLIELCQAILDSPYSVRHIFNNDWIKVRSCMMLFSSVSENPIFQKVISTKL